MTTIVKAANAAQFLSLVPRLLGSHVSQSIVLVPFDGPRTLGALRVDLPADDADAEAFAASLIGMVCKIPTADGVAVVAYSSAPFADGIPHRPLADAMGRRAHACGLRVVDALCVTPDRWGSYLDPELPRSGRPASDLGDAAPDGLDALPAPASGLLAGAVLPEAPAQAVADMESALTAFARAVALVCGPDAEAPRGSFGQRLSREDRVDPRAITSALLLDDLPQMYEDALSWDTAAIDPHDGAALIWCLGRPALRDIALVGWSGHIRDADEALQAQLRWERGDDYPAHLAMRMWGEGDRPAPERLGSALDLVRMLAALSPAAHRPGLLAMCAWLSWALGRSTHAAHYASLAREIDPDHGLAEIVLSFAGAGHLPEWAFDRR